MKADQADATEAIVGLHFNMWMQEIDRIVEELGRFSVYDLPDCTFRDWFDDGVGPRAAAKMALRNAGW